MLFMTLWPPSEEAHSRRFGQPTPERLAALGWH